MLGESFHPEPVLLRERPEREREQAWRHPLELPAAGELAAPHLGRLAYRRLARADWVSLQEFRVQRLALPQGRPKV